MKFKRIIAGFLALTMLSSYALIALAYSGANGTLSGGGGGGHLSGGTQSNTFGFSVGITTPVTTLDYVNGIFGYYMI